MRKTFLSIFVLFAILFVVNGCASNNETSLTQQFYQVIPDSEMAQEVYHIEVNDAGFLVFYRSDIGVRAGLIDENLKWISSSGDASLEPENGMSVFFSNRKDDNLYFSYGILSNPDVVKVISSKDNKEKEAKIVQTSEGVKLWFVIYDQPIESTFPDIIGISKDSRQLVHSNE